MKETPEQTLELRLLKKKQDRTVASTTLRLQTYTLAGVRNSGKKEIN